MKSRGGLGRLRKRDKTSVKVVLVVSEHIMGCPVESS